MQISRRPIRTAPAALTSCRAVVAAGSRAGGNRLAVMFGLVLMLLVLLQQTASSRGFDLDLNEAPPPDDDDWHPQQQQQQREEEEEVAPPPLPARPKPAKATPPAKGMLARWKDKAAEKVKASLSQLPEYFNFERFQREHKRRYSVSEFLFRKAAFLKRCFQVFKARVLYRLGQLPYMTGINKFADRSPKEIKQMFMAGPPIEFRRASQSESEYYAELERVSRERDSEPDMELESQAAAVDDDDGNIGDDNQADQLVFTEQQARLLIERLQAEAAGDRETQMAIRDELRGASGETFSQAAAGCAASSRPLPWPGTQRSGGAPEASAAKDSYRAPELDADDGIDWSEHPCFHTIYDQGEKCGRCYVMASTTLAEFYKCSEQVNVVEQRKFSKKYVIDCGQKFSHTILGCKGGSLMDTLKFISVGGLHNIEGWKEHRARLLKERPAPAGAKLDQKCPLDKLMTPVQEWGLIKVTMNPKRVSANKWLEALQDGPLVASVQMPSVGLETYEGGVHDGAGCATSGNWHAMVLVGYGVSPAGIAYWRFRNSWGAEWGDAGHFNLAMSVPAECLVGGVRVYREPPT